MDMFPTTGRVDISRQLAKGYDINLINSTHIEVVALVVKKQS